jgi:hypothetical protein
VYEYARKEYYDAALGLQKKRTKFLLFFLSIRPNDAYPKEDSLRMTIKAVKL